MKLDAECRDASDCMINMIASVNVVLYTVGHEPGADLGPLISPEAKQRVCDLVQSGVDQGAQILLDGRNVKVPGYEKGNFVGPTILHYVKVSQGAKDRLLLIHLHKDNFKIITMEWIFVGIRCVYLCLHQCI